MDKLHSRSPPPKVWVFEIFEEKKKGGRGGQIFLMKELVK